MTETLDQRELLAPLWIDAPVLALDFEATAADPHTARPVSLSVVRVESDGHKVTPLLSSLIWCGEPIPEDAARVHGIDSVRAKKEGRHPAVILGKLDLLLEAYPDDPLVVYNAGYDLTLLRAEWERWDNPGYTLERAILDPLVWDRHYMPFRKGGERTLGALCRTFGVALEAAHTSDADATAAALLALTMARANPEIARRNVHDFNAWTAAAYRKWRDGLNLYWSRKGIDRSVTGEWLEPPRLAPPRDL